MQATIHITTVSGTTQTLALFVLALVVGAVISLVSVHLLDHGVNPVRDAVSDYGARDHAWFYRIAAIWVGFAALLTSVMLADAMFPKPTLVIFCLLAFAAARWAITIFPTDLEGEQQTPVGRTHMMLAIATFTTITIAAGSFYTVAGADPFWKPHETLLIGLGWFVVIAAIATALTRRIVLTGYFGLVERLLYLAVFAWLSAVALVLLTG